MIYTDDVGYPILENKYDNGWYDILNNIRYYKFECIYNLSYLINT